MTAGHDRRAMHLAIAGCCSYLAVLLGAAQAAAAFQYAAPAPFLKHVTTEEELTTQCTFRRHVPRRAPLALHQYKGRKERAGGTYGYGKKARKKTNRATIQFSRDLNALATSRKNGAAAQKAETALFDMMDKIQTGQEGEVRLNVIVFSTVIKAWSQSRERGSADRANELLELTERLSDAGDRAVTPDDFTYGAVLNAYARSRERGAARKAQALLERMEGGEAAVMPNTIHYNTVINAWANSRATDAADRALELLKRMQDTYRESLSRGGEDDDGYGDGYYANDDVERTSVVVRPNLRTYSAVIKALGRSRKRGAALKAERLLDFTERLYAEAADDDDRPDVTVYNLVIDAWAKSGDRRECGSRAERLLRRMEESTDDDDVRPDLVTYNSVLDALANSAEEGAAERAERIVRRMEEEGGVDGDDEMIPPSPDTVSYTSLIRAWAKSGRTDGPERAEQVLTTMEDRYVQAGDESVPRPSVATYNAVVDAWAKSGREDGAERAEMLVDRMTSLKPTRVTYTSLIQAYANSSGNSKNGNNNSAAAAAADRVEEILDLLEGRSDSDDDADLAPDAAVYTAAIGACGTLVGPERAEDVLRRMVEGRKGKKVVLPKNASAAYVAAMRAWLASTGSSNNVDEGGSDAAADRGRSAVAAADRVERLLSEMEQAEEKEEEEQTGNGGGRSRSRSLRPRTGTYNLVLRGLVDGGFLDRAERLLRRMEVGEAMAKPDADSYRVVIDALEARGDVEEGADERARQLFWRMQELQNVC